MRKKTKISSLISLVIFGVFVAHNASAVLFFSDASTLVDVIANITSFLLKILGLIGIIASVISGIMYLTTFGNEDRAEQAKKSVKYSIIGLIVAIGSFVIIKAIDTQLR